MSAVPARIGIMAARQGGFSAVQVPAPLETFIGQEWGMIHYRITTGSGSSQIHEFQTAGTETPATVEYDGGASASGFTSWGLGAIVYPISGSVGLITIVGRQLNSNSQIWETEESYEASGNIIHTGMIRTAWLVTATSITATTTTQDLADWAYRSSDVFSPLVTGYEGDTSFDRVYNGSLYGDTRSTLDPLDPDTWGITAPDLSVYEDTIADGRIGMARRNATPPSALRGTYLPAPSGWFPIAYFPNGRDWSDEITALGVTLP